jgi:hypothetical protein
MSSASAAKAHLKRPSTFRLQPKTEELASILIELDSHQKTSQESFEKLAQYHENQLNSGNSLQCLLMVPDT